MDTLSKTANNFLMLEKSEYKIVISAGKNKPLETINLNFIDEDLHHILGLSHLDDINIPKNRKGIIGKILSGELNDNYLSQSEYYDNESIGYSIKERIECAQYLEEYLDSDDFAVSVYRLQHDNKTLIMADYLLTCKRISTDEEYSRSIRKGSSERMVFFVGHPEFTE